jgi:hypothetical protein
VGKTYFEELVDHGQIDHIKLVHINIELTKRRMYITDPELVPDELKDANILTVDEPPRVTAILTNGEEVPILFTNPASQVTINQNVVGPDA